MNTEDSVMLFNGKVTAIMWMDQKPIYFVTFVFVNQPSITASRYDSAEHRKVPVSCLAAVKKHN